MMPRAERKRMIPYDYIQTDGELEMLLARLLQTRCTRLAVDVEGENNLHSYGIHVALIQLYDGSRGYIVDALSIRTVELLKRLLEDSPWVKVWFDAANDLLSFQHAMGIKPSPLLDVAIAARLLKKPGGLQALTRQGGSASAKDRFQKSNWMRRPLTQAMLDYAISDVLHLLDLADELMAELERKGLMAEFQARNEEQQTAERRWDPLANFTRIPGYNGMRGPQRRLARVLWHARENYGRQHDLPPGNVASRQELRALIDRGLGNPMDISRFLNERRKKNRIDPADFSMHMREAEKAIAADDGPGERGRRGR
jgi:ribonuclease D